MYYVCRRRGCPMERTLCQSLVITGMSSGVVDAVGVLLSWFRRVYVYIVWWAMSTPNLLSCDYQMVHCAPLVILIYHPPPTWVGVGLLRLVLGNPVRIFCIRSMLNRNFCYVGILMHALGSVFQAVLDRLTHPVHLVIALFVPGVSGCCSCVLLCHCACLMVQAMTRLVLVRVSSITGIVHPTICLYVVHLVPLRLRRP